MSGKFVWVDEREVAKLPGWLWDKYREAPADPKEVVTRAIYSTPGWYEAPMIASVVVYAMGASSDD